jgi:hypothetical protein
MSNRRRTRPRWPPGSATAIRTRAPAGAPARRAEQRERSPPRHDAGLDITSAPGIRSEHDLDDVLAPGRRIAKGGPISGGAAGVAPMGGRTNQKDTWGDGMINEEDRDQPTNEASSVTIRRAPRGSARS